MIVKKALVFFIAFLTASTAAMASAKIDTIQYLDSRFGQNWFIGVGGSINWWQGSDRNPNGNYTAVQWGKPSFGGGLMAGKWINHVFGIRFGYDVNQGKSYIDGLHVNLRRLNFLFDGEFTYDDDGNFVSYNGSDPDENGYYNTSFMYHNLHADLFFSPFDIFQGYYNPDLVYRPMVYVGMGLATVSEGVLITPAIVNNIKYKDNPDAQVGINYEFSFDFGLLNTFKLTRNLDLFIDLGCSLQRFNIDSWFNEMGCTSDGIDNTSAIRPARTDKNYSAKVGLSFNINKGYTLPNNCAEEMEEMRLRIKTLEDDMANMSPEGSDIPEVTVVHDTITQFVNTQTEEIISYPFSIFFNKDSYQLMSKRDLVNLREIAEVAKKNGYKIRLRGSADSATASPAYNQTLSENRCRKVMIELMDMGIPESQIILVPVGGVNELNPAEFDRRVLVELVKEAPKN